MAKFIDLTGKKIGKLTVMSRAPNEQRNNGKSAVYWICKCECGKEIVCSSDQLRTKKSCGCDKIKPIRPGDVFGFLTVKEQAGKRESTGELKWKCQCTCGNEVVVTSYRLRHGQISCGCQGRPNSFCKKDICGTVFGNVKVLEIDSEKSSNGAKYYKCLCLSCGKTFLIAQSNLRKKINAKDFTCPSCSLINKKTKQRKQNEKIVFHKDENYIEIFCNNGKSFKIDFEDYDKIKDFCWHYSYYGYIEAYSRFLLGEKSNRNILLHRLIMFGLEDLDSPFYIDHINHDKTDNRKSNLRVCTASQNSMNSIRNLEHPKERGIYYDANNDRWCARIKVNGKEIHLISTKDKNEAIKARRAAEKKYHKNFAYNPDNDIRLQEKRRNKND